MDLNISFIIYKIVTLGNWFYFIRFLEENLPISRRVKLDCSHKNPFITKRIELNKHGKYWLVWCVKKGFPREGSTTDIQLLLLLLLNIWHEITLNVGYLITNNTFFQERFLMNLLEVSNCHKYQSCTTGNPWRFTNWTKTNWHRM